MKSIFRTYSDLIFYIILAFSLMTISWGNFLITLSTILFVVYLIFDGRYVEKLFILIHNKSAVCFLIVVLLIFIRFTFQLPDDEAVFYIVKYFPMLVFVLALGSHGELSQNQFHSLTLLFVMSMCINTLYCSFNYFVLLGDNVDIRTISPFMSYNRFGGYCLVAWTMCAHYVFFENRIAVGRREKMFLLAAMVWLSMFVIFMQSFSVYIAFAILLCIFCYIYLGKTSNRTLKIIVTTVLIIGALASGFIVYSEARYFIYTDDVDVEQLPRRTSHNGLYEIPGTLYSPENGHWTNVNVCREELDSCWRNTFGFSVYETDEVGNIYLYTLCRYMASKNLNKDADGFAQLDLEDLELVKQGFTNYRFTDKKNPRKRIYETCWELHDYYNGGNADSHSIAQRFEFMKCALQTLCEHPYVGYGTDVQTAMNANYERSNTGLSREHWGLPHNQFLMMGLMTGIFGMMLFIVCFIASYIFSTSRRTLITTGWFAACFVISCAENILTTSAGAAYYVFMGTVLLVLQPSAKD